MPFNKRSLGNLRPNPDTLGVDPLAEGEVSVVARVRARASVAAWWESMTPAERGHFLQIAVAHMDSWASISDLQRAASPREEVRRPAP